MKTVTKIEFILSYCKKFTDTGIKYFSLDEEICSELYYQKMDLFKVQLNQGVTDNKTALQMFNELSKTILMSYIREKRDKCLWQIRVVNITQKLK